jgi:hypothetical protein
MAKMMLWFTVFFIFTLAIVFEFTGQEIDNNLRIIVLSYLAVLAICESIERIGKR